MLNRLQQLSNDHENFAFETTLASKTFAPWLKRLKTDGYAFHLFFLWLPSPEFAVARVANVYAWVVTTFQTTRFVAVIALD